MFKLFRYRNKWLDAFSLCIEEPSLLCYFNLMGYKFSNFFVKSYEEG